MHALRHELPVTIEEDGVVIREIEWGDFHIGHETYETAFDVAPAEGVTGRYVPVPALGIWHPGPDARPLPGSGRDCRGGRCLLPATGTRTGDGGRDGGHRVQPEGGIPADHGGGRT